MLWKLQQYLPVAHCLCAGSSSMSLLLKQCAFAVCLWGHIKVVLTVDERLLSLELTDSFEEILVLCDFI